MAGKKNDRRGEQEPAEIEGWSPEELLEYLEDNPAASVSSYVSLVSTGNPDANPRTLKSQVQTWRRQDPEWAEKYGLLLAERGLDRKGGRIPLDQKPGTKRWKEVFILSFSQTGNKSLSAMRAGVSLSTVERRLNKEGPDYDEELGKMFEMAEQLLLAETEGQVFKAMKMAEDAGDHKTLGNIGLQILERRERGKWSRNELRTVEHTGTVKVEVGPREQQAIDYAGNLSKSLGFGTPRELPAPAASVDVVDAEVVEEHVVQG